MRVLWRALSGNWVFVCFFLYLLGMLSLSFLGVGSKAGRIASLALMCCVVVRKGVRPINDKIVKSLGAYFLCCAFSLLFSPDIAQGLVKLLELFLLFVFVNEGARHFNVAGTWSLFHVFLFYNVVQSAVSLLGYLTDPTVVAEETGSGPYVTFLVCKYPPIHANGLGSICGFGALFCLAFATIELRRGARRLKVCAIFSVAAMCAYVMYLTSSRTSMIAFVFAFFVWFYKAYHAKFRFVFAVLAVVLCVFNSEKLLDGLTSFFEKKQMEEELEEDTANKLSSGRLQMWQYVLQRPERWIFGQGYETGYFQMYRNGELTAGNAHNSFIQILYNSGIISLFFWLLMWWFMLKRYLWLMKRKEQLPIDPLWYHLAAAVLVLSFVRSFGNVNFVNLQLVAFAPIGCIILFVHSAEQIKGGDDLLP